jgi:hypothetical protein
MRGRSEREVLLLPWSWRNERQIRERMEGIKTELRGMMPQQVITILTCQYM